MNPDAMMVYSVTFNANQQLRANLSEAFRNIPPLLDEEVLPASFHVVFDAPPPSLALRL
jgi:hypothetical protein